MKYILFILISIFSIQSFASDDWWIERQIWIDKNQETHAKKVYGKSARVIRENAPISSSTQQTARDLVRRSIAVDIPTPTKVGTPMLQRIKHVAKTPGVQMVGAYAVMQLIEGIGWVMEDGTYVKKIPEEPDDSDYQYLYSADLYPNDKFGTVAQVAQNLENRYLISYPNYFYFKVTSYSETIIYADRESSGGKSSTYYNVKKSLNPNYVPKDPEIKTVPLTAALLGAAMLGQGYNDPDPNFNNDVVNTGKDTGVVEAYTHDPSGIGDQLADDMDDKLRNAPQTPDGQPSSVPDPGYDSKPLSPEGDNSADRSWDSDAGQVDGESKPQTDPVTGEPTGAQSISIKFPVFCEWASSMCKWYDDWTASDKVYKDHIKKTEDHQTSEKTFWQTVKDWFDWTKEEPDDEPETEQPDVDDQGIFSKTFDTTFTLSKQCPPDIPIVFESTYLSGSFTFSMNWLCIIFSFMAYPLVFLSHCLGIWILYEAVIQKEIKW
ncbi:hypothetical protein [Acinetobacter sp. SH20PTE14]|uniref:hypothetical protein n=1 Tax=Acinetobacter sp. SH20PTE14 TaxID=2905879 RepID=UPI001F4141CE|nr:hypothetical protein [Acinetobacter sp. SH20PTE14]UIJ74338.1 hypothetical protein LXF01_08675 [Acinetobacter sp. SH20PTE14]UIJ74345.1 hypothetical protein LXF01_08715 [Acinetobacter sp. SH20PTE14]